MLDTHFDHTAYNALDGPEEAYAALLEHGGFDDFLDELAELTDPSPLRNCLGASLLHRHFEVEGSQCLVERAEIREGRPALVTAPSSTMAGVPTRWRLDEDGRFAPLEYSIDLGPVQMMPRLAGHVEMLARYALLLRGYELGGLIGLCLVASAHLVPSRGLIRTEETDATGSVVTLQPDDDDPNWIPTAWLPAVTNACNIRCHDRCRPGDPHVRTHIPRHY